MIQSLWLNIVKSWKYKTFFYLWRPWMLNFSYSGRRLYQYNKDDFLLKFWLLSSFFRAQSLQVNTGKRFFDSFTLFPWLCVFMLLKSLVEIKIKTESFLQCIDIYDDKCMDPALQTKILKILKFNLLEGSLRRDSTTLSIMYCTPALWISFLKVNNTINNVVS